MKNRKVKICLVGNEAVGKTSLIRRYVLQQFTGEYLRTMGAMVSKKSFDIDGPSGKVSVDMMVWDIMGRKEFVDLVGDAYFEYANGIMAVCDSSRRETLVALERWIEGVRSIAGNVPLVILANKSDFPAKQISDRDLRETAEKYGATYFWTSAKTGENVEEAFRRLALSILASPQAVA